jgi:MFS family permease
MTLEEESLLTGYTGRIVLVLSLGWFVALLGRSLLSPLLPTIIESLSISPFQAGLVLSVMMALHSVVQYPAGTFSDELTCTTVLVGSLGVLVVGFAVLAIATNYWLFLLGGTFAGLGTGLYYTPQRSMLSNLFVERRGRAFGVNFAAGSLGSALSAGVAVVVLAVSVWQQSFLPLAVLTLFILLLLHRWSRETYVLKRVRPDVGETLVRIRGSTQLMGLIVTYALFSFTWQGVVGFLPTYLQSVNDLSPTLANAGFALLFVVAMIVMPLAGRLSDSVSRPLVAIGALTCAVIGLGILVTVSVLPLIFIAIAVFAVGVRAYPPVMQAHIMDIVPEDTAGGDFGAIKTIYTLIGSAGPMYVGFVSGIASYTVAFIGLLVALGASISISLWMWNLEHAPVAPVGS